VEMANDDNHRVVAAVARNQRTPAAVLRLLERTAVQRPVGSRKDVLSALAENPKAPADVLERLAGSRFSWVRTTVARNPAASEDLLARLASDRSLDVRGAVASNPLAPRELLEALASVAATTDVRDERVGLSWNLLNNPSLPPGMVADLAALRGWRDRKVLDLPCVKDGTVRLPDAFWDAAKRFDPHFLMDLATRPEHAALGTRADHYAGSKVETTCAAIEQGAVIPDGAVRSWGKLPNEKDAPFEITSRADLVDGQPIGGLRGEVVRSERRLDELHEKMGNCLDTYAEQIREGKVVVVTYDDPSRDEVYAAGWSVDDEGRYSLFHVNSKFNRDRVPWRFRAALDDVTRMLNDEGVGLSSSPLSVAGRRRRAVRQVRAVEVGREQGAPGLRAGEQAPAPDRAPELGRVQPGPAWLPGQRPDDLGRTPGL
jgi:hypothetical protein